MTGNYKEFYTGITAGIRRHPHGREAVVWADRVLTGLMYAVYPVMLVVAAGLYGFRRLIPYVLIPGISFALVSLVRDRLNRKRPYEEWPIDPLIHKETKGHSMPSRHVFSSVIISMSVLSLNLPSGVILLIISFGSALIRVLGGVHYPKDVAAGYLLGVLAGLLYLLPGM